MEEQQQFIHGKLKLKKKTHPNNIANPVRLPEKVLEQLKEKELKAKMHLEESIEHRDKKEENGSTLPWVPKNKPFSYKEVYAQMTNAQLKFLSHNKRYVEKTAKDIASNSFQETNEKFNEFLKLAPLHNDLEGD